jgi:hypothetical protein
LELFSAFPQNVFRGTEAFSKKPGHLLGLAKLCDDMNEVELYLACRSKYSTDEALYFCNADPIKCVDPVYERDDP